MMGVRRDREDGAGVVGRVGRGIGGRRDGDTSNGRVLGREGEGAEA